MARTLPGERSIHIPGFFPYGAAIAGTVPKPRKLRPTPRALATAIGRIALERFRAGLAQDPAEIDANYVRRSDAELFWREG